MLNAKARTPQSMLRLSRQIIAVDLNSLFSLVWFVIVLWILLWFYNTLKRIEKSLEEIKKQMGVTAQSGK
jgi:uncharacterized protein YoxC